MNQGISNMKKLLLVAAAGAAFATPAVAAPGNTDQADGVATATVVSPINIEHDAGASLSFGTITAGTTGGTVVVTRAGNGSATGDVTLMPDSVESADSFTVTGDANRDFGISATGGTVSDGTNSMSFTTNVRANHTLDGTGTATLAVGGTLTVGADQAPGAYTGTYTVTVTYN